MVILAMGKLGGREMNYHSDLDLVFLYEAEGNTAASEPGPRVETTTNQHFFSELAQAIIKMTSRLSVYGRLYEVDARLRPTGKSGALTTSLGEFVRYFAHRGGQLWERQALCKARVVFGSKRVARAAVRAVNAAAFEHPWRAEDADTIRQMRHRQEKSAAAGDVKRGPGGIVDIEFLVQMLQLKHGRGNARLRMPNALSALAALGEAGHLDGDDGRFFAESYRFLRTLESRLGLISATTQSRLPDDPTELTRLAHLFDHDDPDTLLAEYRGYTQENRRRFDRIFDRAAREC
jgi:glutamate-ammonia-ligase adenylyltransferase